MNDVIGETRDRKIVDEEANGEHHVGVGSGHPRGTTEVQIGRTEPCHRKYGF